eukprot:scaffold287395_cov35-Tisochrysis_lutea.AAC.1
MLVACRRTRSTASAGGRRAWTASQDPHENSGSILSTSCQSHRGKGRERGPPADGLANARQESPGSLWWRALSTPFARAKDGQSRRPMRRDASAPPSGPSQMREGERGREEGQGLAPSRGGAGP